MVEFNESQLKDLRAKLPRGYNEKIRPYLPKSKKHVTKAYLSNVINGRSKDELVIEAFIALAEAHQKERKALTKELQNRMDKLKIQESA